MAENNRNGVTFNKWFQDVLLLYGLITSSSGYKIAKSPDVAKKIKNHSLPKLSGEKQSFLLLAYGNL